MVKRVKILWTKPAEMDLAKTLDFLRRHSIEGARKVVNEIRHGVLLLSEFPEMGKVFELVQPAAREIVVGHYRLFYDYINKENKILILALFDSRQNPKKIFSTIVRGRKG